MVVDRECARPPSFPSPPRLSLTTPLSSSGANYTDNSLSANRPQTLAFDVERGSLLDLKIHKQVRRFSLSLSLSEAAR